MDPSPTSPHREAIARHERYLLVDPTNRLLLRALGDLHHQAGHFDEAMSCYRRCLAGDPKDRAALSRIAGVHLSQAEFSEAEHLLLTLIDAGDPDPVLQHNLGMSLYHQTRWAEAVTALQRARTGGLREADNLRYLAYALHHTGDSAGALNVCNDWMQLAPSGNAAGYRALLQMDNGDMASAVIAARDLAAAEPDNGNANLILGLWAAERQDIDDAAHRFERLVQTEPGSSRVWLGLALVQMLRQDCPGAIGSFRQALSLDPGNVGTLVALGWAQFTQDDFTAAEETFRHAIRVERNFGEAHGGLAAALVRQNRREEARRSIALARGLDSKGFGLVYARSVLMALEGRRDQGVQLMARNLERSVRPDGRTLMDGIRVFLRSRMSAAPGSTGQPRATPPRRLPVRR